MDSVTGIGASCSVDLRCLKTRRSAPRAQRRRLALSLRAPPAGRIAAQNTSNRLRCIMANSSLSIVMAKFSRRDEMIATLSS